MINAYAILFPVLALAAWTACILFLTGFRRFRAGAQGRVRVSAFRRGESDEVPEDVALPNRNYINLLELPVLFYVVCLMGYVTGTVTLATVALAWTYVALRVLHSVIHVTYNNVMHRFAAFAASNFVLLLLWILVGAVVLRA